MKVTKENLGEVLQRLYDSEIDVAIAWLRDWGVDYSLENKAYPLCSEYKDIQGTWCTNIVQWLEYLVKDVLEKFPNSTFTKWWNASE